jgi:hypothetical protein
MVEKENGTLPSDAEIDPREQCQAIILKSGKVLEGPIRKEKT